MSPRTVKRRIAAQDHAELFAALGDETRLALVAKLAQASPQSISRLAEDSALTRQAITKHLRVLEDAGVVESSRTGRESLFAFKPAPLKLASSYLATVTDQWNDALTRLKAFAEK
jgi:DNA-binding transcriptional ArsR family regulator